MKTKRGLNGCVLKWIAIILMAIDHFGASILENFLLNVWDVSPLGDLLRDYPDYWDLVLMADRVIRKNMIKWARMCGSQNPPTYFRPHMYMDRQSSEKTQKFVTVHLSVAMPL